MRGHVQAPPIRRSTAISLTLRINDRIRVREVRLIGASGEQVGIVPTFKAMDAAREQGLDLVEVSPDARPPVCKILDYGKYKYEHEKREKEARKKQHIVVVKEIKIRPKIGEHDLDVKLKHVREFFEEGDRVRLVITFRGREMAHQELGRTILAKALDNLADVCLVEQSPKFEGNNLGCLLAPKAPGKAAPKAKPDTAPEAAPKPSVAQ
ncbi:MAG TPA: translation initiation factor IF-3 [bacterium]|nr:translation initiation factor IF-3 [bacterium]